MEGRREFLQRFFPKSSEATEDEVEGTEQAETQNVALATETRRSFLEKMAAFGIALALPEKSEAVELDRTATEAYYFLRKLFDDLEKYNRKNGVRRERSIADNDIARERFLNSENVEKVKDLASKMINNKDRELFYWALGGMLSRVDCQGIMYAVPGVDALRKKSSLSGHKDEYFGIRISDYLPSSSSIGAEDIDPRLGQVQSKNFSSQVKSLVKTTLEHGSAWAAPEKIRIFRAIADSQPIRDILKNTDLTVAEYFSLIKATVKSPQFERALKTSAPGDLTKIVETVGVEVVQELLYDRDRFCEKHLLDRNTEELIILSGYETPAKNEKEVFSDGPTIKVAAAAGVDKKKIRSLKVKKTDDLERSRSKWVSAIENSERRAVVVVNTHGQPNGITITTLERSDKSELTATEIARAMVSKIQRTGDPQVLGEMTIFFNNCFSYDLTGNIVKSMRDCFEVETDGGKSVAEKLKLKWDEIALPTFITIAQESSIGYKSQNMFTALERYGQGIKKDGFLSGRRLLQQIQPEMYWYSDMTVFEGSMGKAKEIAEITEENNSAEA